MREWKRYSGTVIIGVLAHQVAALFYDWTREIGDGDYWEQFHEGIPWEVTARVAGGILLFWLCRRMKGNFYERYRGIGRLTVVGLIAVLYLGFAASEWPKKWPEAAGCLAALVTLGLLYPKYRRSAPYVYDRNAVEGRIERVEPEPRPGLILFLSYLVSPDFHPPFPTHAFDPVRNEVAETQEWRKYQEWVPALVAGIHLPGAGKRLDDRELLGCFGKMNLRMPLEAIRIQLALAEGHAGGVRRIMLLPSCDMPQWIQGKLQTVPYSGSYGQVEFFQQVYRKLFEPFCTNLPGIESVGGVDFESEEQISGAIAAARGKLAEAKAEAHYLDTTGGQASCSVVAAIRSLGHDERCQYISTRDYRPVVYDFVAEVHPEVG